MTLDVRGLCTVMKVYITVIIKLMNLLILITLYDNLKATKKRIILYPPNTPLLIFLLEQMFDTERRNCI